jgi:hypothetical protein
MQRDIAFVARRKKEHTAFGDMPADGFSSDRIRNVDRPTAMQDHEAVGERVQLALIGALALNRGKGLGPAEALARGANVGLKLMQDTVGILYPKDRFRLHRAAQYGFQLSVAAQVKRNSFAISTYSRSRLALEAHFAVRVFSSAVSPEPAI